MALDPSLLAELGTFSTPSVLNGLKHLGVRPEQLQVVDRSSIGCMSPALGVRVGYAVTRLDETSTQGEAAGVERNSAMTERLYELMLATPEPRILVVENVGDPGGPACIWGEVMANVNVALGCTAGVTNGPVRDLPEMEDAGFQTFAAGLAVGGGFVRTKAVGGVVRVGGVDVSPGDLIHGDMHGVLKVPIDLAPQLPAAVREVEAFEQRIVALCRSDEFSVAALSAAWSSGRH